MRLQIISRFTKPALLINALLLTLTLIHVSRAANPGDLDSGFGANGKVTTAFGNDDAVTALAFQTNNKTIAVGYAENATYDFAVARYNINGSLDPTFGTNGKVSIDFGSTFDIGLAVAVQADNKILVTGYVGTFNSAFGVARLNADGSLDTTFGGGDGLVTTDLTARNDDPFGIAVLANGKIVVGGRTQGDMTAVFCAVRYNSDGSLDPTFGAGGITFSAVTLEVDDEARAFKLQPDGKLLIGGFADPQAEGSDDAALFRFNADGSTDTAFGTNGRVVIQVSAQADFILSLAVQSDGRILAAGGSVSSSTGCDFMILRFDQNGTLDTTFGGGDGIVTIPFPSSDDYDIATGIARQTDGKIVVGGTNNYNDFALARLNADGTLDNSFGTGGKVLTAIGTAADAQALAIRSNGRIVLGGRTQTGQGGDFALAQYLPSSSTAAAATVGGRVTTARGSGIANARVCLIGAASHETPCAKTNAFGFYRLSSIPIGGSYMLTVAAKNHQFAESSIVLNLTGDVADADFIAEPAVVWHGEK